MSAFAVTVNERACASATASAQARSNTRIAASGHEAEVAAGGEAAEVREHVRDAARIDTVPARERGRVLVDGEGRDDLAIAGVVGIAVVRLAFVVLRQRRHGAVEPLAAYSAADDEVVAAPAVIGAVAVDRERTTEIGCGECGDAVGDAHLDGRRV